MSHIFALRDFLIWDWKVVQMFWVIINNFILNFCPRFCLGAKEAIFGDTNSGGDSLVNSILVLARYFIYQQKFTTKTLDIGSAYPHIAKKFGKK